MSHPPETTLCQTKTMAVKQITTHQIGTKLNNSWAKPLKVPSNQFPTLTLSLLKQTTSFLLVRIPVNHRLAFKWKVVTRQSKFWSQTTILNSLICRIQFRKIIKANAQQRISRKWLKTQQSDALNTSNHLKSNLAKLLANTNNISQIWETTSKN